MSDKLSDKVFASAEEVLGHGGEKVPILGHLIWYSVKESRIKIEDMRKLFAQIGLPADFLPEEPSNINAYKRATTELSEEIEVKLDLNRTAVYMVRLTAKSNEEIVKSIIKEVRDAGNKRLSYEEIGRVHFDKDTEDVRYYDLQPDSQPIITQIKQLYETYRIYLTGKQIRAMFHEIIQSMSPTLVRPSGAVYFIPYVHADMVQKMEVLSKELASFGITDFQSAFESIPLIDADKTRALVELRFEEQNTRDVDKTLVELAKLLQGSDATARTAAQYVEQVKKSKETISKYEGLLNKEMSIARMKVEVLDQQVQKLVDKVAQRQIVPESKPEVKKDDTRTPSIAVVVPHPEQTQALVAAAEVGTEAGITAKPSNVVALAVPDSDPKSLPAVIADSPTTVLKTEPAEVFTPENMKAMEQSVRNAEAGEPEKDPQLFSSDSLVPSAAWEEEKQVATSVTESPAAQLEDRLYVDKSKETQEQREERNKEELRLQELLAPSEESGASKETALPVKVNESAPVAAAAQEEIPETHDIQHHSSTGAASPAEFTTESLLTGFNMPEED